MRISLLLLLSFIVAAASPSLGQDIEAIAERIDLQRYEFPQEKIHVMTDRGSYLAGDTIWFRAWVVDAMSHQPLDASQFVYVELVAPNDHMLSRVKIHRDADGVFQGYLPLDVNLPEGRYQLTAYTMFMQSVGTEYFYSQPLEVMALSSVRRRIVSKCVRYGDEVDVTLRYENVADGSPSTYNIFGYESHDKYWNERQYNERDKDVHLRLKNQDAQMPSLLVSFDNYVKFIDLPQPEVLEVTFYPEGGYLIPDVENTVTFKVVNTTAAMSSTGELLDSQGRAIATLTVEHDGMGIVKFTPHADVIYTARWKDNFDEDLSFELPKVRPDATIIQVNRHDDGLITVNAAGIRADSALIVLQQRGRMLTAGYGSLTVDAQELAAGVIQAMLFDNEMRCLSERLFFAEGRVTPNPEMSTDKATYNDREQVKVNVDLSGLMPETGNYAVSVIDSKVTGPVEDNIYANLLLQSDLRGRINQPNYYFDTNDSISTDMRLRHLDMLMLTQGWRRYDIPRVLRGRLAEPQFPLEMSQVVTGRVLSDWRKKPVIGAKVSLIAPRIDYSATAVTDSLGEFAIAMPLLPDSVDCIVMAENIKGKKQMNLELDSENYPQVFYVESASSLDTPSTTTIEEQEWRLEQGSDWRHIILNELLVTTSRPRLYSSERNPYSLTSNKIAKKGIRSIEAAARALPGLMSLGGNLYTAGGKPADRVTIYVDGEPVLENFTTDVEGLKLLERSATTFSKDQNTRKAKAHTLLANKLGNESNYALSEVTIAESMISFKDLEYVYFARAPHGGGHLYIQHKEGYHAKDKKEPNVYLKITQLMGAQQPVEFYAPRYDRGDWGNEPGSDLRTTLYWNPCVTVDSDGKSTFDFFASDAHNTSYTVTVEGITAGGTPFSSTHNITKR